MHSPPTYFAEKKERTMGKYFSITCPHCGRKVSRRTGYSVQELIEMDRKGAPVASPCEETIITCPHCGTGIDTEADVFRGPDDFVAFFD